MKKYPALSLFILLNSYKKAGYIDTETILAYQIGRLKKYFKQVFLIIDGKNRYQYLGVPVFMNIFRKHKNLGKIATGLLKTRLNHSFFLQHDKLCVDIDTVHSYINAVKGYQAVLAFKSGNPIYDYGAFRKETMKDIIADLEKGKLDELGILRKVRVNYVKI
ncbi:hypothetical protein ACFL4O_02060 [bacterium]